MNSSSPEPTRPSPCRGWYALLAFGVVFTIAILVMVAVRAPSSTDFRDFWNNAVHFRETGEIAADRGVHNYLPFFTIFMAPWGFLPLRVAAVLFVLFSLALFALTVYLVEVLLHDGVGRTPWPALLVALALALPYVYACAVVGNLGLLLLFLVVATWFLAERGHEWEAGLALGLATVIKLIPGLLIVFFLLKGRWRLAVAAAAVTLVLGLGLPLGTRGWRRTLAEHQEFYRRAVEKHSAYQTITSDKPIKANYGNNALPIVLRRLLSPVNAGGASQPPLLVNVADLPGPTIFGIYTGLMVVLIGLSVVCTFRVRGRWSDGTPGDVDLLRVQFGVGCCLMLLASPLVWTHYLPLAYWPLAVIADRAERTMRSTGRRPWVCSVTLLIWLAAAGLLAWPAARAAGAPLAGVLCLWVALSVLSLGRRSAPRV